MIRPSLLGISQHCGLAPVLAENDPRGPGSRARVGTAYHAIAAGTPMEVATKDLTQAEVEELAELRWPGDIPQGATRERRLGLSPTGRHSEPGAPGNLTEGTPDVFWIDGKEDLILNLADYKTGQLPVEEGPLSLQLVAYGFAAADLLGCDAMRLGIWYARGEGRWDWSEVIPLDSSQAGDLWKRVVSAATAPPVAQTGPHCESCWQRAICPARLLPAIDGTAVEALSSYVQEGPELTPTRAAVGLQLISAMREVADRAEEHIRAEVMSGRLRIEQAGKVYGPSEVAGRRSASVEDLTKAGLTQYVKTGKPYLRWGFKRP